MRKFTLLLTILIFIGLQVVNAQKRQISGKVRSSEDGSTLPGVSVVVKGTTLGTVTDVDGTYKLEVPADAKILQFSFVGMKTMEVTIGAQKIIDLAMVSESKKVEEVVITAIGIKRETKALGYSVQEVKSDQIDKMPNINVVNDLNGKVAGVQVTSSAGTAGASSNIIIRGQNSILGSNQPLFIVDGVPIDNSMSYSGNPDDGSNNLVEGVAYSNRAIDLNPDDIASMSVLKGGAATALYGLRAANGAIIITTKKGSGSTGNKINVEYSTSYSFDYVNKLPKLQNQYAQGSGGKWQGPSTGATKSWGPLIDTMRFNGLPYAWDNNGALVGMSDPTATSKKAIAYDNLGNFFVTGHTWNNAVNVGGGNSDANYYFSMSDANSSGVVPDNTYERTTVKIAGEAKLSSKFKASGSVNYIKSGGDRIQQGSNLSGVMLGLLRTSPTFDNSNGYSDAYGNPASYMFPDGTQRSYSASYDNPYWTVNQNIFKDDVNRMIGNFSFDYIAADWLTVTYRLGSDWYSDRRNAHFAINSDAHPEGEIQDDLHFNRDINSDIILNIKKDLCKDFQTNIILGQNMYSTFHQQIYNQGNQLTIPDFYNMSNASSLLMRESIDRKRTAAYYGDFGFSFKDMLFMNLTGREEWSTTLPKGSNSFFYPSASFGFVFTELPVFNGHTDVLSFGKIRASYAVIANDAPEYGTKSSYGLATYNDGWTSGVSFPFLGHTGFMTDDGLGSSDLKPEKLTSREIGTDLRFFNNRIGLDVAYYKNTNKDLILWVPQSGSDGYTDKLMNAATMENKGWEILFNIIPVKTKDFQWDLTLNYTKHTNMVKSLAPGVDNVILGGFTGIDVRVVAGQPYGVIYSSEFVKDSHGNVVINDEDPTNTGVYGYPMMAPDQKPIGSIQPDWQMGITNEFKYKGVSLSFLVDIKEGGLMWDGTRARLCRLGMADETSTRTDDYVFSGIKGHFDANGNLVTSGSNDIIVVKDQNWYSTSGGDVGSQEPFTEKTNWVRLREITLSYSFNPKYFEHSAIKGIDIFFTGKNLFLSTPYKGIDPETNLYGADNAQGIDYFNMPNTKSYIFGLKVKI
ncbi:MAG: SusC/RagA family TonB-linked outer membrane protein [Bacteroidia bacterium]|nr:SusC/RagA family TonB-linked outer membrane protein [Bacteroidia bacterium]